jgi:adenosylcobyric acid synthase
MQVQTESLTSRAHPGLRAQAPVLMVQGTASHAGKSVLVAALCRWFARRGLRVAPFKAQNMSLNAGVTPDGREIGRAQMLQARAALATPRAEMNPILLKPHAETRSQVVVMGERTAELEARDYFARRDALWPVVARALDTLRADADLVVAEGAGSPAEINLYDRDLVNMAVARHADAAVLLVGDIERGGVFAALAGTMQLLPAADRARVRGFIINKFRGDVTLVHPGPAQLEAITGVPTLGVLPFLRDLDLPEEDALGAPPPPDAAAVLDIAVVRLPHVANFDDFDPLRRTPGVGLRWVDSAAAFGRPDLVILPGSKTTIADLAWLRAEGLADRIVAYRAAGGPVLGICGGYQMLGTELHDADGIESATPRATGLGLLAARTRFAPRKRTRVATATVALAHGPFCACDGLRVEGYEIHVGVTETDERAAFRPDDRDGAPTALGAADADGLVIGTYLHGLFANDSFRRALLGVLAVRRGTSLPPDRADRDLDIELDRWAAFAARHLDMERIAAFAGYPELR